MYVFKFWIPRSFFLFIDLKSITSNSLEVICLSGIASSNKMKVEIEMCILACMEIKLHQNAIYMDRMSLILL